MPFSTCWAAATAERWRVMLPLPVPWQTATSALPWGSSEPPWPGLLSSLVEVLELLVPSLCPGPSSCFGSLSSLGASKP